MINHTEVLLTEAMHGAIIADSLRVPWIPIVSNPSILSFKWDDWCQSLSLEYQPVYIKRLHHPRHKSDLLQPLRITRNWTRQKMSEFELRKIAKNSQPYLSNDNIINAKTRELEEKIEILLEEINQGVFD
jgi:succinoglycan biosynthesis protein ExoV